MFRGFHPCDGPDTIVVDKEKVKGKWVEGNLGRSGPGLIYALRGPVVASVGRLTAWEYRDSHKGIKRRDGPANGLYGGLAFCLSHAMLDMGEKMPPAGRRRPRKRRGSGGEYRGKGGYGGRPGGHKKARPSVGRVVV